MYYISLSVTLFIIIAAVHLLAKVRNENLGILSKLGAYLVLVIAVLMLACQLYRGIHRMEKDEKKMRHHQMMMGGEENIMFKKKFRHGEMKGECMMTEDGRKCKMTEDGKCIILDGEEDEGCCAGMEKMDCCKDSAKKGDCKMHKEVEVIIKEE